MDKKHSGIEYSEKKRRYICPECKWEGQKLTHIDAHRLEKHGIKARVTRKARTVYLLLFVCQSLTNMLKSN